MTTNQRRRIQRFLSHRLAVVSLIALCLVILLTLFAPWLFKHVPEAMDHSRLSLKPGAHPDHWLGTDDVGRDLLSRLVYGARYSLGLGFLAVVIAGLIGVPLGLLAGYRGGWVDLLITRLMDMMLSLPNILLAMVMVAIVGPGLMNTLLAISLVAVPNLVLVVRSVVLVEKPKLYVEAARGFGSSPLRLVFAVILPNCLAPILVQSTLGFSDAILNSAALGFLGLGVQPPSPEWGVMLADSRASIESAWWLVTLPGMCILLSSLAFNLLGDGLRDALDPRMD